MTAEAGVKSAGPFPAYLLLGPTGAGKTPLGQCLEREGLWGRRCAHFDFGENLRLVAAGRMEAGLTVVEMGVVRNSLETGALLENEHFAIAGKILGAFAAGRGMSGEDRIVLNGLPRHAGQARDVAAFAGVRAVIFLECSPEVVFERIRINAGGDREGRADDDLAAVRRKLAIFAERTMPLLDHYRHKGVRIHPLSVGVSDDADRLRGALEQVRPGDREGT